jgi:hypothetical protein
VRTDANAAHPRGQQPASARDKREEGGGEGGKEGEGGKQGEGGTEGEGGKEGVHPRRCIGASARTRAFYPQVTS